MVTFFTSSLGKIALAVAFFTSLSWAHDFTGLYHNWSSLMCAVVFTLMHDCLGFFVAILGQQAVR